MTNNFIFNFGSVFNEKSKHVDSELFEVIFRPREALNFKHKFSQRSVNKFQLSVTNSSWSPPLPPHRILGTNTFRVQGIVYCKQHARCLSPWKSKTRGVGGSGYILEWAYFTNVCLPREFSEFLINMFTIFNIPEIQNFL